MNNKGNSKASQRQEALQNKIMLQLLKDLDSSVRDIESKLRQANLIKGHANNLKKLSLDVNKKIDIILEPNTPGEKQLNSGHI